MEQGMSIGIILPHIRLSFIQSPYNKDAQIQDIDAVIL
jgi:hypothetical protein